VSFSLFAFKKANTRRVKMISIATVVKIDNYFERPGQNDPCNFWNDQDMDDYDALVEWMERLIKKEEEEGEINRRFRNKISKLFGISEDVFPQYVEYFIEIRAPLIEAAKMFWQTYWLKRRSGKKKKRGKSK
jgi:hypothetical protein